MPLTEVRGLLEHEIDLQHERDHLVSVSSRYERLDGCRVPELLPWATRRLTAMTRIDGVKVNRSTR